MLRTMLVVAVPLAMLIGLLGCAAAPTPGPAPTVTPTESRLLVVGRISPESAARKIKQWEPFAQYLASQLAPFGFTAGEVRIAADTDTMAVWLASGVVDLYIDSPYDATTVMMNSGALPVLRRWKGGRANYNGLFFAQATSGLASVADLKGRVVALQDPSSTSSYMLPVAYLLKTGLRVAQTDSKGGPPAADEVGYVFTHSDDNTIQWVISGKAIAGVVDDAVFKDLPAQVRGGMTVLGETEVVPRGILVVRPGMDPALQGAIRDALQNLHETAEGQALLRAVDADRFDEFPDGMGPAMARLRELYALVQRR